MEMTTAVIWGALCKGRPRKIIFAVKWGKMGIPQGLIPGPLLFGVFVNSLTASCQQAGCHLCADVVKYVPAKSSTKAAATLTAHLNDVHQWMRYNRIWGERLFLRVSLLENVIHLKN